MDLSAWKTEGDAARSSRAMKFMKVCNLPGLKQTRATKSQKWCRCGGAGSVIYTSTKLDDVPFATVFVVDDCISVKAVDGNHVSLTHTMEVKFVQSTMMKGFIEQSTNKEVVAWCKDYLAALRQHAPTRTGAPSTANGAPAAVEPAAVEPEVLNTGPLAILDNFFDSIGFSGGRYMVAMFAILFLTLLFFAFSWRGARGEISQLRNEIKELSQQLKIIAEQTCGAKH